MRVLLIEGDPMLGQALVQALRDAGMSVDWLQDGFDAEAAFQLEEGTKVYGLRGSNSRSRASPQVSVSMKPSGKGSVGSQPNCCMP
jgi:hypothetical protein